MPNSRPKHPKHRVLGKQVKGSDPTTPAKTGTSDPSPTLTTSRLRKIRNTEEYALLKARFQALFVWPALVSTILPEFDRKDFSQKAKTITAGEEEVENLPRVKTKGYPLSRGSRFYRKQVMSRSQKQGSAKKSRGSQNQSDEQVDTQSTPVQSSLDQPVPSGSGEADLDITSDSIGTPRGRGRPRGKMKRKVVEAPTRSLRERKEKSPPEKKIKKEKGENSIRRVSTKRAILARKLRQSMLDSVAAMEAGLRPDPAQDITGALTGALTGANSTGSGGLVTKTEKSSTDLSETYTVVLPPNLECLPSTSSETTRLGPLGSTVLGPINPTASFGGAAVSGVDIPSQLNTVSMPQPGGIPSQAIPMILSYIKGEDGTMIPVLNHVSVVPNVESNPLSLPKIKIQSPEGSVSPGPSGQSDSETAKTKSTS
ncbi:uncharacterized protein LOC124262188 [Haliotis rubra]|uniref:uncharacterized protein LOC124262188 n=1 Tax=Haliotis rubra TaxID=36100 RepID=UPI001EE52900|nr:uncharacterized protein LOC124262188 [Haliotis rubra]